ncbi:hypothetical protein SASPL_104253 [Salvia splendens]|uniref:Glucan endo-1,3-beta-D-glucosidase n=1 Tax=Salvia splendens TaxID=180675 RepID=A0A8X8YJ03_SALSN|nr:hypothetical protein SASPL_104253 [Salvia splendens]
MHAAGQVGTFYGRLGNNLPSSAATVRLYQLNNIRRMRLFDPHGPLNGTNIRLIMGVSHPDLRDLANCPQAATAWVRRNILRFPNVTFRQIIVGNEIEPASELGPFVFPAMQNVYRAVRAAGLRGQIKPNSGVILGGVYYDNLFYVIYDAFIAQAPPLSLNGIGEEKKKPDGGHSGSSGHGSDGNTEGRSIDALTRSETPESTSTI